MPPRSENERKERLLINLMRLRRIGRLLSYNDDLRALEEDMLDEIGAAVSQRLAARMLGVSHPALSRWINSGHLPLVESRTGRAQVSVPALLDLMERAEELREEQPKEERRRPLEAIMGDRARAIARDPGRVAPKEAAPEIGEEDKQRVFALRALARHRAIARNLDRAQVDAALDRLQLRLEEGIVDEDAAREWRRVLKKPVADVAATITEDSERGRELRRSSPFA